MSYLTSTTSTSTYSRNTNTEALIKEYFGAYGKKCTQGKIGYEMKELSRHDEPLKIKKVIYDGPATIVFWTDNTKTVVKCLENEPFDAEKGLAMACAKKLLGNKGRYYNDFKRWVPNYTHSQEAAQSTLPPKLREFFDLLGGK